MNRDTRLLREFQISLVTGGATAVFAVLDIGLTVTGILPWGSVGPAAARLAIVLVVAAIAFANAGRVWRRRGDRDLGGVTFADASLIVGFSVLGAILLLGLLG
jgi:hypothetical protein